MNILGTWLDYLDGWSAYQKVPIGLLGRGMGPSKGSYWTPWTGDRPIERPLPDSLDGESAHRKAPTGLPSQSFYLHRTAQRR